MRPSLPDGPYLIVGLARSGAAAATMLRPYGRVLAADTGTPDVPEGVEASQRRDGRDQLDAAAVVVKSPGVPHTAPVIAAAIERGMPVLGELELAWRLLPQRFVAVTGTNGKTTTTELLGAMHRAAGVPVAVAGNVGTPLSLVVGTLPDDAVVVCECSSFQLEDSVAFAPDVALLLNLTEDHLDRHGTVEAYRDAKLRIFANQEPGQVAVAPPRIAVPGRGERVSFDLVEDGVVAWQGKPVIGVGEIRLRGAHNLENALGATAAALASGLPADAIADALRTFAGVRHRLEEIVTRDGVLYVNDSKATNVDAAQRGIESFERVHVILGGSLKGGGFTGLREAVATHCRAAYLIGQATEELERDLAGTVPLHRCGDLATALQAASAAAVAGEVVLLSPACASYDQFRDYEQRGDRFRELLLPA